MKLIILSLFFLIISSCGVKDVSQKKLEIEPAMEYLLSDFEETSAELEASVKVDNLVLKFVDSFSASQEENNVVGLCDLGSTVTKTDFLGQKTIETATPVVSIKKSYFYNITTAERHELVFHELGHCILKLGHISGMSNSKYLSVMNPSVFSGLMYSNNFDYYMKQLFGKIQTNGDPTSINYVSLVLDSTTGASSSLASALSVVSDNSSEADPSLSLIQSDYAKLAIQEESITIHECRALH
jgi:hypothetical protein